MDINTAAQDVLDLIAAEGQALSADVNQAEALIRAKVQQVGQAALQRHLWHQPRLGYEGSSRACECGANQKFVGYRGRTLATLLGAVSYQRAYYHCKRCGRSCCPYDRQAKLGDCQVSLNLAKAATLLAIHDPFSPSARVLRELTGVRLGQRTIQRLTHRAGQVADARERELALRMASWNVPLALANPKRLYVAVDGTMVHELDGWHEVKCVTCWWEDDKGRGQSRYAVRLETAEQFKAFVWSLACQCGLESAAEVVLLGDGAGWIWDHIAGVLGEQTICITDWYHVMEHVWTCGRELHGEGTQAGEDWAKKLEAWLWEGQWPTVVEELEQQRRQTRSPHKRSVIESLRTYLSNQGDRLSYQRFREMGLDIGSGRVEAACKHVVQSRMKRSGMRWSPAGAQRTLSLRSVWLNGQWADFWRSDALAA